MSHHSIFCPSEILTHGKMNRERGSKMSTPQWSSGSKSLGRESKHTWHQESSSTVEVNCRRADSSLSGKRGHCEFQPWLPERHLSSYRKQEQDSLAQCWYEWQIGTRRNSPPKETNLLLEVFLELIRSTYIHAAWKILTWLWGFGSLGVCSIGVEIFPLFSLNTFILLRSFRSRVLTFSQSPNCISSKETPAQQARNVSRAFVEPVLLFLEHPSAELPQLQVPQAAWQACACPDRAPNWCSTQAPKLLKANQTLQ